MVPNEGLQPFPAASGRASCCSLFQAKEDWSCLETLPEAATSFLGFPLLSLGPKVEPRSSMSLQAGIQAHGFQC